MDKLYKNKLVLFAVLLFSCSILCICNKDSIESDDFISVNRLPVIKPDYTSTVIPPNIAPLDFIIKEPGIQYHVKIYSENGSSIKILSSNPSIIIPLKDWKKLLKENHDKELKYDIFVRNKNNQWQKFNTIINKISKYEIDGYLVYRLIKPLYNYWTDINIYQRKLESFDETCIFTNKSIDDGCVNCHTFYKNSPDKMLFHVRSAPKPTMILVNNGKVSSIFSQTPFSNASMAYSCWHPDGRYIAFSVNKVHQFFHAAGKEVRDVVDNDGAIGIYDTGKNIILTPESLKNPDILETYPEWSPDGKYLYYCSSPILWEDRNVVPPENYRNVKYSLMRIEFNRENGERGKPECILSSNDTGLSIIHPKISPDGKFLLFCMAEYGCFSIYQPGSDLYMMNLETHEYNRLPINSDMSDSYHCWSDNGRWIVFSSKRLGDVFARPFFSYIDENGNPAKPFVLPQKDPEFYDSCIKTYNIPELITGPVKITRREIEQAMNSPKGIEGVKPVTKASPAVAKDSPWKQHR